MTATVVVLGVVASAVLIVMLLRRGRAPSIQEVIRLIENRINHGMSKEWDYFRLVTIKDKHLNAIRERCLALDYSPPDERERELKKILDELRKAAG